MKKKAMVEYDKYDGLMTVQCDTHDCGSEITVEGHGFAHCMGLVKEEGWRTFKEGADWKNSCPDCFNKWKENSFAEKIKKDSEIVYPEDLNPKDIPF